VSFVHFAMIDTESGRTPLSDVAAFQRFQEHIRDRCDEPPAASELAAIGSYRL
jgi:hypothetical protein